MEEELKNVGSSDGQHGQLPTKRRNTLSRLERKKTPTKQRKNLAAILSFVRASVKWRSQLIETVRRKNSDLVHVLETIKCIWLFYIQHFFSSSTRCEDLLTRSTIHFFLTFLLSLFRNS